MGRAGYDGLVNFLAECPETGELQIGASQGRAVGLRSDDTSMPLDVFVIEQPVHERGGFAIIARDRSEREQLEERVRRLQKMEMIGTLAGGIAHDFNNILAAILGYTELAMGMQPVGGKAYQNLQQVYKAGQRASHLVQQILAFSRKQDTLQQPVPVGLVALELIQLLRPSLPATIEIQSEIDSDAGSVLADPTQLHQVMLNLCDNAAHAMAATGGSLRVGVENVQLESALPTVNSELSPGEYVRFEVADTGIGITPELLARIFDPSFTTKERGAGTGMGLAVVRGVVDILDGGILVTSQPGKGATFQVYLPRADLATASPPPDEHPHQSHPEQILCIDEENERVDVISPEDG
jgi:signal transduction histidine kinase